MGTLSSLMYYLAPSVLNKSNTNRFIYCHVQNSVALVPKNETHLATSQGRELWGKEGTTSECPGVISMGSCEGEKVQVKDNCEIRISIPLCGEMSKWAQLGTTVSEVKISNQKKIPQTTYVHKIIIYKIL